MRGVIKRGAYIVILNAHRSLKFACMDDVPEQFKHLFGGEH